MASGPKKPAPGSGHKPKTACQQRATHRAAQAKYVAKAPAKQAARVQKSQQKAGNGKNSGSKSKGSGKNGSTIGRPRKGC